MDIGGLKLGHTDDHGLITSHWNPKPGDVCLDIGTGPGAWTVCAVAAGAVCYGFSPDLGHLNETAARLVENGLAGGVLLPLAMWSHTGLCGLNTGCVGGRLDEGGDHKKVPVITMDDFAERFNLQRLDHVNIDAEWAECHILRSAKKTLGRFGPKIIIEVHPGNSAEEVQRLLLEANPGYVFDSVSSSFVIAHTGGA